MCNKPKLFYFFSPKAMSPFFALLSNNGALGSIAPLGEARPRPYGRCGSAETLAFSVKYTNLFPTILAI